MIEPTTQPSVVVGIGFSAGGLTALQELVAALSSDNQAAFVIAQHLSPDRVSSMVELLQSHSTLPVSAAIEGQSLVGGTITVAPPNSEVTVDGNYLRVEHTSVGPGPSPSIDLLFQSIADSWGNRGVGVILSGTGSDGANGMRVLKAAESMTLAQSPASAKFDAMPKAAILTGGVDLVLTAHEIGVRLSQLAVDGGWLVESVPAAEPGQLASAIAQLRRWIGIDFSGYKSSTLRRQIQRRMVLRRIDSLDDYLAVLSAEKDEAVSLQQNLLVTVTSFFRDNDSFDVLATQINKYVSKRKSLEPLRVWVPGCATGEEVYSIAMLIGAALEFPADLKNHLRIFGTDLDEGSLSVARRALYPTAVLAAIPAELRVHYVTETPNGLEVTRSLRDCVVFARNNCITDPPFTRLDLISCRNTLIYFNSPLQDHILGTFRHSLVQRGLLFLGKSENLGHVTAGFEVTDFASRIFTRTGEPMPISRPDLPTTAWQAARPATDVDRSDVKPVARIASAQELLLGALLPPSLVLDENHNLIEVIGDVSEFCRLPAGSPPMSASQYLLPEFWSEVRALLLIARADNKAIKGSIIALAGQDTSVQIEVRPLLSNGSLLAIVSFLRADKDQSATLTPLTLDPAVDSALERLERQLNASQDFHRHSEQELESANEELHASSEELQASYEELETTNEELRAINDQLDGSNEELNESSQQLGKVNHELEVILASLDGGIILVDSDFLVTRFSTLAIRLFALVFTDIGHSLLTIPTTMPVPGLAEALTAAVRGEESLPWEVSGDSGAFMIHVLPHQGDTNRAPGAIVRFNDVSGLVQARQFQENVFNSAVEPHVLLTPIYGREGEIVDFRFEAVNEVAAKVMQGTRDEIVGTKISDRYSQAAATVAITLFAEIMTAEHPVSIDNWPYRRKNLGIENFYDFSGFRTGNSLSFTWRDVTEKHNLALKLASSERDFRLLAENATDVVVVVQNNVVTWMSPSFLNGHAGTQEAWIGTRPQDAIHPEDLTRFIDDVASLNPTDVLVARYQMFSPSTQRYHWIEAHSRSYINDEGVVDGYTASLHNVDDDVHKEAELMRRASTDQLTGTLNRGALFERLEAARGQIHRTGKRNAALFCDIDRLKDINDNYGHAVGDSVLQFVAQTIEKCVRKDDPVARFGGDEFLVFLVGVHDINDAATIAENIRKTVESSNSSSEHEIPVSISIGVILVETDELTDAFIKRADRAMYKAKQSGRNQIVIIND